MKKDEPKKKVVRRSVSLGKITDKEFESFKIDDSIPLDLNLTFGALQNIRNKEPEFFAALSEAIVHLNDTYGDKYEAVKSIVDTKQLLYDPEKGKYLSLYQTMRYLQRFFAPAKDFDKGENKKDILKAIHYLLFHNVMLNRRESVKNIDIKG